MQLSPSPIAQPYRKVGERLYVPADTVPHPPMTDAELRAWLLWEVQVLHPAVGMIGCGRGELLRVAAKELIEMPIAGGFDTVDLKRVGMPGCGNGNNGSQDLKCSPHDSPASNDISATRYHAG